MLIVVSPPRGVVTSLPVIGRFVYGTRRSVRTRSPETHASLSLRLSFFVSFPVSACGGTGLGGNVGVSKTRRAHDGCPAAHEDPCALITTTARPEHATTLTSGEKETARRWRSVFLLTPAETRPKIDRENPVSDFTRPSCPRNGLYFHATFPKTTRAISIRLLGLPLTGA